MNMVLINPSVCGGTGIKKWEKVKPLLDKKFVPCFLKEDEAVPEIRRYYERGIRNFIAAGGDGTVNFLLNKIIDSFSTEQLDNIKLGAIGLGSSNDFHKPFNESFFIDTIPGKINFNKTEYRDVGCISYLTEGRRLKKYFLINFSIGITAEANHLFNNPDKHLSYLKKRNTSRAIMYTALKTIINYKNFPVNIRINEQDEFNTDLTNLAVLKNSFVSGTLRYNCDTDYSSGLFDVFICSKMSFLETIQLLRLLGKGKSDKVKKKKHWKASELNIESSRSFYLEYDGEILKSDNVSVSILPKLIKVCTC